MPVGLPVRHTAPLAYPTNHHQRRHGGRRGKEGPGAAVPVPEAMLATTAADRSRRQRTGLREMAWARGRGRRCPRGRAPRGPVVKDVDRILRRPGVAGALASWSAAIMSR
jgi:hypothetical protein